MDTSTLLLGAGQLVLTVALACIAYMVRRDAKRSSLVALVKVLSELRERNSKTLNSILAVMSSEDFKRGDERLHAGLTDSLDRLRAIQAAITEALLHSLHQCDTEWGFSGRLHAAFRSQADADADKVLEKLIAQHG